MGLIKLLHSIRNNLDSTSCGSSHPQGTEVPSPPGRVAKFHGLSDPAARNVGHATKRKSYLNQVMGTWRQTRNSSSSHLGLLTSGR
mmetsp:Transcript_23991/g.55971  ORF Transcript_23991/g.55971 Transcript_23991/m.55971 type:complete len:86 (+) Transcript_23991:1440-1697(+)